jgi:hypothetical protein
VERGEGTRQAAGRASDGRGRARRAVGVAGMIGMGGAVGPVWWEGRLEVGMGGAKMGRGMADDGGLHLFPFPKPPPLGEEGNGHGRCAVAHHTLTHDPTSSSRQYRRRWYSRVAPRLGRHSRGTRMGAWERLTGVTPRRPPRPSSTAAPRRSSPRPPVKDDSQVVVMCVNAHKYDGSENFVSCASCTTNGLGPMVGRVGEPDCVGPVVLRPQPSFKRLI